MAIYKLNNRYVPFDKGAKWSLYPQDITAPVSLRTDGSDEYLNWGTIFTGYTTADPFSLGGWFRVDNISLSPRLFGHINFSERLPWAQVTAGGEVQFTCPTADATAPIQVITSSGAGITSNTFFHLAVTKNNNSGSFSVGDIKIYVNGTDVTPAGASGTTGTTNYESNFVIMRHRANYTAGYSCEFFFAASELSSSSISTIYNSGTRWDMSSNTDLRDYVPVTVDDDASTLISAARGSFDITPVNMETVDLVTVSP